VVEPANKRINPKTRNGEKLPNGLIFPTINSSFSQPGTFVFACEDYCIKFCNRILINQLKQKALQVILKLSVGGMSIANPAVFVSDANSSVQKGRFDQWQWKNNL
jgi:hypothetical protein